ncbi:hypothetical protein GCM10027162_39660 [Streptomyces incanus]
MGPRGPRREAARRFLAASGVRAPGGPALKDTLTPGAGARARAGADTFRTDGAAVAAKLLLDAVSRERGPMSG